MKVTYSSVDINDVKDLYATVNTDKKSNKKDINDVKDLYATVNTDHKKDIKNNEPSDKIEIVNEDEKSSTDNSVNNITVKIDPEPIYMIPPDAIN
ncbi:hypothetical protein BTW14_gp156 [BeAn 58058 virus]|uniref:hypothetical protein n=1 Tax=BeAn 58058 virus TaxID=67082 RepID=UPI00090CAF6C|nr:hypothetical protein BTW14_gp156 [BeAn 58058 virus]APG58347.1 hypothetical protein BAV00170 [BeAn 58058 virus]